MTLAALRYYQRVSPEWSHKARIATRFKVCFANLIDPTNHWFAPYLSAKAFEVYHWLVRTASRYRNDSPDGAWDILSDHCGCVHSDEFKFGPDWRAELHRRFQLAVLYLGGNSAVWRWRKNYNVTPTGSAIVVARHYAMAADVGERLDILFSKFTGRRLKRWWNSCHKRGARWIHCIQLRARPDDRVHPWAVVVQYGYKGDSSYWEACGLNTVRRSDETFHDFVNRAIHRLEREVELL